MNLQARGAGAPLLASLLLVAIIPAPHAGACAGARPHAHQRVVVKPPPKPLPITAPYWRPYFGRWYGDGRWLTRRATRKQLDVLNARLASGGLIPSDVAKKCGLKLAGGELTERPTRGEAALLLRCM